MFVVVTVCGATCYIAAVIYFIFYQLLFCSILLFPVIKVLFNTCIMHFAIYFTEENRLNSGVCYYNLLHTLPSANAALSD